MRLLFQYFLLLSFLFASSASAAAVLVNLCNAYPGTSTVQWTWGATTSNKIGYQSCSTATFDNTITTGTVALFNSAGMQTTSVPFSMNAGFTLCADGNRNILITYNTGTALGATLQFPSNVGCNALPSATPRGLMLFQGDCAIGTVDFKFTINGKPATTVALAMACGTSMFYEVPGNPDSGSGSTSTMSLYTTGTSALVAGPFDLTNYIAPKVDGTMLIVVSGDQANAATSWYSDSQPASSGAKGLGAGVSLTMVVAVAAVALFFARKF